MKITLRKKDSVTSIILFLFNLEAELSGNSTLSLSQILEHTSYFGKTESAVRTCLSRMVAQKILLSSKLGSETTFCLSEDGLFSTELWNRGMSRFFERMAYRNKQWDQQWHFISLREFNKSDYDNLTIVEELRESGMRELSRGFWIFPYPVEGALTKSLNESGIRIWQIAGSLKPDTNLEEWLESLFHLSGIRDRYLSFLEYTEEVTIALKAKSGVELLPELFHLGWAFFDIIVEDPALPIHLLPDWEGDKALTQMKKLRNEIISQLNLK